MTPQSRAEAEAAEAEEKARADAAKAEAAALKAAREAWWHDVDHDRSPERRAAQLTRDRAAFPDVPPDEA